MKVHNQIFNYQLSPSAIKVYIYLAFIQNGLGFATVKIKTIMDRCNMNSPATVYKALAELEAKDLAVKTNRYNQDGHYIANGYYVTLLTGNYFYVPSILDALKLPKSAFQLYMYLNKRKRDNGRIWPTIRAMATELCASCNTILGALRDLVSAKLIKKAPRWHGKHNLYTVCGCTCLEQKNKGNAATTPHCPTQTENCTINFLNPMIRGISAAVNRVGKNFSWVKSLFLG